ncbi:MAG TPA: hypothetical protein VLX92_04180, partial [Kofleriaceae bacterium]|nr:hypothetical protein [Kofleriaceae bacterium]
RAWHVSCCLEYAHPPTKDIRMSKEDLPTIDPDQLAAVTGGATTLSTTDPTASTDPLTAEMQSLLGSIQDLAQNQNNSMSNQFMELMPFMMMMMGERNQAPVYASPVAPAAPPGWTLV